MDKCHFAKCRCRYIFVCKDCFYCKFHSSFRQQLIFNESIVADVVVVTNVDFNTTEAHTYVHMGMFIYMNNKQTEIQTDSWTDSYAGRQKNDNINDRVIERMTLLTVDPRAMC